MTAALSLLLLTPAKSLAQMQEVGDTLEVHYRVGQSDLDPGFSDNKTRIDQFVYYINKVYANVEAEDLKLDIYTGASPEGPTELNRRLGEQRGISLKNELEKRIEKLNGRITIFNQGARWGGLYRMIENSNEPWKYEVMSIIGKEQSDDEWQMDPREKKLRELKKGQVWKVLNAKYLPTLRSSGSAIIARIVEPRDARDTLVIRDTIFYLPEPCPSFEEPVNHDWVWALKTNFLLWGVVAPNVQIELPLGKKNKWSIEGEVFWPWWIWSHSSHAHQCGNVGLELKRWLGDREKRHLLDGWHIGLGVGAGYYDFEWDAHKGYQGEYLNVYCNLGYQHRFGKRKQWAIDGGLAIGWIPTKYREYLGSSTFPVGFEEEYDDHLMWQKSSTKHIIGATHANISLAYLFNCKKKKNAETTTEVVEPVPYVPTNYLVGRDAGEAARQADKRMEKLAKEQKEAEEKAAKEAAEIEAKSSKADAKAAKKAAKEAEKQAKAQAKIDAKAAKEAEKQAEAQAKIDAKAAKEAAKQAEAQAKIDAKAAKEAAKEAEKQAEAQAKAEAEAAKEAAKQAEAQAKAEAKAAKEAEKIAKAQAKAEAKAQYEAEKAAKKNK